MRTPRPPSASTSRHVADHVVLCVAVGAWVGAGRAGAVFVVAVQATGTELPVGRLLPLAMVVLLASAVPANIAGWGPREGAAAWAFGAVGLSAAGRHRCGGVRRASARRHAARCRHPGGRSARGLVAWDPRARSGRRVQAGRGAGGASRGRRTCLNALTHCSAAACRSTATSPLRPTNVWCCPTMPTSTGSTPCARTVTRSSWAPPPSATTTPGCWCVHRHGAPSASPAACRQPRSR